MSFPGGPTHGQRIPLSGNPEVRARSHWSPAVTDGTARPLFCGRKTVRA